MRVLNGCSPTSRSCCIQGRLATLQFLPLAIRPDPDLPQSGSELAVVDLQRSLDIRAAIEEADQQAFGSLGGKRRFTPDRHPDGA
jgi:hypothetical protein